MRPPSVGTAHTIGQTVHLILCRREPNRRAVLSMLGFAYQRSWRASG